MIIQGLVMSLIFNLVLLGFMFYKLILIPKDKKRVIIINERNGKIAKIIFDLGKVTGRNTVRLMKLKREITYGTEIIEDGKTKQIEKPYEFVDKNGKDVLILRTDGELFTYCDYESGVIKGLTKDKRKMIYDFMKTKDKQYDPENRLDKFLSLYGRDMVWGIIYIATIFVFLKFGGEPSDKFVSAASSLVNALNSFKGSIGGIQPGV